VIAPTHTRFRWLERGDGEPVLLLHGLLGEMDHWESALDALGPYRRPIALELPIFDPDLTEVSLPALADYVRRFMEAIELPPAVVCGNSLGGHVALELALTHPGWVDGLILTGSSGLFERSFTQRVPHQPTRAYVRERMDARQRQARRPAQGSACHERPCDRRGPARRIARGRPSRGWGPAGRGAPMNSGGPRDGEPLVHAGS